MILAPNETKRFVAIPKRQIRRLRFGECARLICAHAPSAIDRIIQISIYSLASGEFVCEKSFRDELSIPDCNFSIASRR